MKVLVFSDSHGSVEHMRFACQLEKPDWVLHLGDYVDDGNALLRDLVGVRSYQVAGNCDKYRVDPGYPLSRTVNIGGVNIFMAHGHVQRVKMGLLSFRYSALEAGAQVALFGHTHGAFCQQEGDLWMMNPGSCQSNSGSYGVITIENKIPDCRIVWY